jgi:hypothetical protein
MIVGFWTFPESDASRRNPLEATRADGVARSLEDALRTVAISQMPDATRANGEAFEPRRAVGDLRALPSP